MIFVSSELNIADNTGPACPLNILGSSPEPICHITIALAEKVARSLVPSAL
jgi:hypothetical protein